MIDEAKIKAIAEFLEENFEFKRPDTFHPQWQSRFEGAARVLVTEILAEIEALEGFKKKETIADYYLSLMK